MYRFTLAALLGLTAISANASDILVTTFGQGNVVQLKNASLVCDGENLGSNIYLERDGVKSQIPFTAIALLRTRQSEHLGFFIKTNSGSEITRNKMLCSSYEFVGENEFGGMTSVPGDQWRLVRVRN